MTDEKNKSNMSSRFSASAETYDSHAHIQKTVASLLMKVLPTSSTPSPILEIGCGTGHMTRLLFRKYPHADFHLLDVSADMINQCRLTVPSGVQAHWFQSDIEAFESEACFPLIVSNSVLHWVEPLVQVLAKLRTISTPPAELVCSIMMEGTLGELREVRAAVAPDKPPRRRLPDLQKTLNRFTSAGYEIVHHEEQTLVAHYSSTAAFLRAIHEMGVTGGPVSQSHSPLSRSELQALEEMYQERYEDPLRGVRAGYKVLFLKAYVP